MRRIHTVLLVALLAGACGSSPPAGDEAFWSTLRVEGDEVEGHASVRELARAGDLVVRGRLVGLGPGRTIATDSPQDTVTYADLQVDVRTVLGGAAELLPAPTAARAAATVPVEVLVPEADAGRAASAIGRLAGLVPPGDVVVVLRAKRGAGEAGRWRLVDSHGLWTGGPAGLDTPLSEEPPGLRFAGDLLRLRTLDDLGAEVRRARGGR